MTGSPAEALLAAHQLSSSVVRQRNGRPYVALECSCKRLTLQLGVDKDEYLLHLIEAARTDAVTAARDAAHTPEPPKLAVAFGWLCDVVNEHTCGAGDVHGHEPTCGLIPIVEVEKIQGWGVVTAEQFAAYRDALNDATLGHLGRDLGTIHLSEIAHAGLEALGLVVEGGDRS